MAALQDVFSYHFAILAIGWDSPSFSARREYPKLCQSIISFDCRRKHTREDSARVGIEGGFYSTNRLIKLSKSVAWGELPAQQPTLPAQFYRPGISKDNILEKELSTVRLS